MRIAIITAEKREHFHDYANPAPYFATAPGLNFVFDFCPIMLA